MILVLEPLTFTILKKELRKNIKKGDAQLTMQKWDEQTYWKHLTEFRRNKGLITLPMTIPRVEYYVALKNNESLCGQGIYFRNDTATETAIWRKPNAPYFAGDWLKWRIMQDAKLRGMKQYDFAGVSDYKQKWGGTILDNGLKENKPNPLRILRPIHRLLVKKGLIK